MLKKVQLFVAAILITSAVAAISENISCKEFHSGSFLPSYNSENFLLCDFPLYPEKKHL